MPSRLPAAVERFEPTDRAMRRWAEREPVLDGLSFAELRRQLHSFDVPEAFKDALLAALVRLSLTDEDAQVALVAMLLPALRRAASTFGPPLDPDDVWGELVGGVVRSARRCASRPRLRALAANLALDALAAACAWARRERRWRSRELPLDHLTGSCDPALEVCPLREARRAGVVGATEERLVRLTRLEGSPLAAAATAEGLSYEAAKKRRQRAEAALAAWLTDGGRAA